MDEGHHLLSCASISSRSPFAVCQVKDPHLGAMLLSALQPPYKSIQLLVWPPQDRLCPAAGAETFHVLNTK